MTNVRIVPTEVRMYPGLELRSTDTEGRYVEAIATTFGVWEDVGYYEERMDPGVFDTSLSRSGADIKLLVSHEHVGPAVGKAVEWRKSDRELRGVFEFGTHEQAEAAYQATREGMFGGVSVGFLPGKGDDDNLWEEDAEGYLSRVTRMQARLLEVSLTTVPANPGAQIVDVRSMFTRTAGVPDPAKQRPNKITTPNLAEWRTILDDLRTPAWAATRN